MPQVEGHLKPAGSYLYYRHKLPVRVMHWVNVVALTIMFMSGLQIFNAHAALYWGKSSYDGTPPVLTISSRQNAKGEITGYTRVFGHEFDTTGVLGASKSADGRMVRAAFPSWLTIPGSKWLSMARTWHFFFAWVFLVNGVAFVLYALFSRHLARDLAPTGADLRGIGASIKDHLRFRHPEGEEAKRYNVLQKLAYLVVIFLLLPLDHPHGLCHVTLARFPVRGMGRHLWRQAGGTDDSLCRGLAARWLCSDPRVRGHHHRALEQPAVDDHRTLPRQHGVKS